MIFGGRRLRRWGLGVCALVCAAGLSASVAMAEDDEAPKPPPIDGTMSFRAIQGPAEAEVYSWTVELDGDQELVQIDDKTAGVIYAGGPLALSITATAAHDATGTDVPTSLEVIAPDVVVLTVHHRAGNPAAGGAPFAYPVVAGIGWEGGLQTHVIDGPRKPSTEPPPPPPCVVPRLTARTLPRARARLASSGCTLGKVRGERSKGARVRKQFRQPGTVLASGARVAVKLG